MSIFAIIRRLPEYAEEAKASMRTFFLEEEISGLTEKQLYGIALTAGYYIRSDQMLNDIRSEAKLHLEEQDARACKLAVIRVGLGRMRQHCETKGKISEQNVLKDEDVSIIDYTIYSFTAALLDADEVGIQKCKSFLLKNKVSKEGIDNIIILAGIFSSASKALALEQIRSYDFIAREPNI